MDFIHILQFILGFRDQKQKVQHLRVKKDVMYQCCQRQSHGTVGSL